jgi:hypothetical protein
MKKVVTTIAVFVAALSLAGVAAAANTPGNLSGGGDVSTTLTITRITLNEGGVTDGEISDQWYNRNNDKSGDCNGDTGSINVRYSDSSLITYNIVCAHYSNCRSMSVSYIDTKIDPTGNTYVIFRALNTKPPGKDQVQFGSTTDADLALRWVNLGFTTSGAKSLGYQFPENELLNGNWTLTPNPSTCTPPA